MESLSIILSSSPIPQIKTLNFPNLKPPKTTKSTNTSLKTQSLSFLFTAFHFPLSSLASEETEGPVSEVGLLAIVLGCRELQSILYFCQQMNNAAVVAMSKNCPDLVVSRLCIICQYRPDRVTGEPMDEGFGAIVKNCKKLTRLAVSGLLTDKAFCYIGQYGKLVRTLVVAFTEDSDTGLKYYSLPLSV
ncbi:putative leucine-rich repeat domain superfamily [Helianthus annuus]|nr:putative leucine-rich repeat domain superfamily [Helianthus annuus]KAJ0866097.1 putative leucine-rich repeat domain superfamily [Helianthus annuus]